MSIEHQVGTRREFLVQSQGLLALLALSDPARSAEPPSEALRVGFIGIGWHGKAMLARHLSHTVAVCDVDGSRLEEAREMVEKATGRKCGASTDYRHVLDRKDVDAVVLATPDHWHALQTVHACQAGKDVYAEKPLTHSIAEGRAMVAAARRHRRVVQTGSQQRSAPEFRTACELVRNGYLGKVHTIRVGIPAPGFRGAPDLPDSAPPAGFDYDLWLGPAPQRPYNAKRLHYNFRFYWDYGGGQLTNWGAHHLDIVQWALGHDGGCPLTVTGRARYRTDQLYETPEWFDLEYQYPGNVTVRCGQDHKLGITFEGEKGTIYVNRGELQSTPAELIKHSLRTKDVRLEVSRDHYDNWLECIKSRKTPICDVEIGHRSATVCHLGNLALRVGRKITWDPVKEEIVGDREAARLLSRSYRAPWDLTRGS
jgi:predicted dehydrogenase